MALCTPFVIFQILVVRSDQASSPVMRTMLVKTVLLPFSGLMVLLGVVFGCIGLVLAVISTSSSLLLSTRTGPELLHLRRRNTGEHSDSQMPVVMMTVMRGLFQEEDKTTRPARGRPLSMDSPPLT